MENFKENPSKQLLLLLLQFLGFIILIIAYFYISLRVNEFLLELGVPREVVFRKSLTKHRHFTMGYSLTAAILGIPLLQGVKLKRYLFREKSEAPAKSSKKNDSISLLLFIILLFDLYQLSKYL